MWSETCLLCAVALRSWHCPPCIDQELVMSCQRGYVACIYSSSSVVHSFDHQSSAGLLISSNSSLSAARWTVACVGHVGSFAPTCQCHSPMRAEAVVSRHTYCRAQQPGIDLLPSPWTAPQARACVRRTRSLSGAARGRRLLAASAGLARARALPWPPLSRSYKIHMRR